MTVSIKDLTIRCPDVPYDGRLPERHSANSGNQPPRLQIDGVPSDAVELAVICHDPDAPLPYGFTHWILYGIDPGTSEVGADADQLFRPGLNDTGVSGYFGPQPPPGHGPHHYYFWVYALSVQVEGTPSRREFLDVYGDNVIEQNRFVARFETGSERASHKTR